MWEGGLYEGDDQARLAIFEHAGLAECPPAYIDLELAAYQRSANVRQKVHLVVDHPSAVRKQTTQLVLSSHDFSTRPLDLHARMEAMNVALLSAW
ncbi:MAG: type I 3-dehydroquinate dehydratase [Phycisphaerales bacterium]|nr:type I 3-dehydroquinate dehydratase [Phycisphaerales bacterium]